MQGIENRKEPMKNKKTENKQEGKAAKLDIRRWADATGKEPKLVK